MNAWTRTLLAQAARLRDRIAMAEAAGRPGEAHMLRGNLVPVERALAAYGDATEQPELFPVSMTERHLPEGKA